MHLTMLQSDGMRNTKVGLVKGGLVIGFLQGCLKELDTSTEHGSTKFTKIDAFGL